MIRKFLILSIVLAAPLAIAACSNTEGHEAMTTTTSSQDQQAMATAQQALQTAQQAQQTANEAKQEADRTGQQSLQK